MSPRLWMLVSCALLLVLCSCSISGNDSSTDDATAAVIETRATEIPTEPPTSMSVASPTPSPIQAQPSATETIPPTDTPAPEPTVTPTEVPTFTPEPVVDLLALLPMLSDLPSGYAISEEGIQTNTDIAATHPNPDTTLDRLQELDFRQGAIRSFEIPGPGLNDLVSRPIFILTLVKEFESDEQAAEYMKYDQQVVFENVSFLQLVSVEAIGAQTDAAQGSGEIEGGTQATYASIWVREGQILYRFYAGSGSYNSLEDLIKIARVTIERNHGS